MPEEKNLKSAIENSRKISEDGSLVTYDLTKGVDFSDPKSVARIISDVFFEKDVWTPIGDASITMEKTPITIGVEEYWEKGLGTKVLAMLISRARKIWLKKLKVSGIYEYNERSLRLYRKAGFSETEHFEEDSYNCIKMELEL